jgi:hypothetical protein
MSIYKGQYDGNISADCTIFPKRHQTMKFKLGYTISRLDIRSSEPIILPVGGSNNLIIEIRTPNEEEKVNGHKSYNAFCDVIGVFEPSPKALPVFNALLEGKRPPEGKKAKTAEDMVVHNGSCWGLDYYPNPFITFTEKIYGNLSTIAKTSISYLRWRYAQEGPPAPISTRGLSFSVNESMNDWHSIPGSYSVNNVTPSRSILKASDIFLTELKNSIIQGIKEPVYHELLREAKELKFNSSRSCTLISISAAEIAVKKVINNLVPKSQWFIDNIQSPPTVKLIKEYFQKIIPTDKYKKIKNKCEQLAGELETAILIRNQIAHHGINAPEDEKLERIIKTVEQLLWVCDYCSGNDWALTYIELNDK